ncbi:MAG: hypothetical protein HY904_14305 [Deltaproteobacteria bacterium]|nr:hypothetical protein [Deltaproteobacteria bacterium]
MEVNELPVYDKSDNPTGCCPRFHPEAWDDKEIQFDNKLFVRASTVSLFHIPLNMSSVFSRTWGAIEQAHADRGAFLVLTQDESPWHADHLFCVDREIPGADMVRLTGNYLTRVFEGPYSGVPEWCKQMAHVVEAKGKHLEKLYYFYTTCPKCAKAYGHNYVVGFAQVV